MWPKSFGVSTRPLPKWNCHTRFTITRVDIKPDGNYEFFNVPPGRFIIRSRGEIDSEGIMLFGSFTLNIDGRSAAAVDMTLLPGASASVPLGVTSTTTA